MTDLAVEWWLPRPGRAAAEPWRHLAVEDGAVHVTSLARPGKGTGRLALPAPVNAHDHGYGIRTLDFGGMDDALEPWIAGLRLRPATDPHLEALVAFGRVARGGCAATMHCHNSLRTDSLVDEAAAVIDAARICGIRLGLSCPLLDASPFVYGGLEAAAGTLRPDEVAWLRERLPAYAPIAEQIAAVDEISRRHAGPMVDVQYGPIGPQWCSDPMLEAIAGASATTERRVHMHLLESPRQRAWLDRRFPGGIVRRLDEIGLLSPRLTVAHGVQLRPDETELLAERGVRLVSNPSANLRLRSGILPAHCVAGLDWAVGLDGTGFDDRQDIWAEMRLFRLLHNGDELTPLLSAGDVFRAATDVGAQVVGCDVAADAVVVDWAALSAEAIFQDEEPAERLLARMTAVDVTDLVVAGEHVVRDGRLTRFDGAAASAELAAQARADRGRLENLRDEARHLATIVRRHYAAEARARP